MTEPHGFEGTSYNPGVFVTGVEAADIAGAIEKSGWKFGAAHAIAGGHAEIYSRGDHALEMGWAWESAESNARQYLLSPVVLDGQDHSVASVVDVGNVLRADPDPVEPEFDFFRDVIGDDIVVEGITYSSDVYVPDYEGGVRRLTEAERAARDAERQQAAADRGAASADTAGAHSAAHVSNLQERSAYLRSIVHGETSDLGLRGSAATWRHHRDIARDVNGFEPPWVDVDSSADPSLSDNGIDHVWYDRGPDVGI